MVNKSDIVPIFDFMPERSPLVRVSPADLNAELFDDIVADVCAKIALINAENWRRTTTVLAFIAANADMIAFDPIEIPTEPDETAAVAWIMFTETIDPIPDIDEAIPDFNDVNDATVVAVLADTDVDKVKIDVPNDVDNAVNLLGTLAAEVAASFKDDMNTVRELPIPTNPTIASNDADFASLPSEADTDEMLELTLSLIFENSLIPLASPVKPALIPSGIATPFHFLTAPAKFPNGPT